MASTARVEVPSRVCAVAFAAVVLLFGHALAADTQPKVVCESDASGTTMNCRDVWPGEDAAPFRRIAPAGSVPIGAAPQPTRPLLAPTPTRDTQAARAPDYLRAGTSAPRVESALPPTSTVTRAAPAVANSTPNETPLRETTVSPPAPASVVEAAPMQRSAPSAPALPPQTKPVQPAPSKPAIVVQAESMKPAAAPPERVVIEPTTPAMTTTATSVSKAVVAAPMAVAAAVPVALFGSAEFRALDGSHYTLELANAKSPQPLRELAARLRLSGSVYLVHLRSPESDRWLLTWADHAGQSEARSSRSMVPADAAINSGWPRRIAPLQNELVSP
ncbi:MAG: hypothetical protein ABIR16_00690 [Dokdonella sp.]